ncbi:LarC family nickel insertion protein [Telmatospirillum sp. J64-1]|uniref:LarC family nickel insertion protein n=1 Tax=Telmatospirillum sp. J64-1 TaxID=2502183 RepID=UPI00163DD8FE|nr:LarC family nickel insertion protein [Telmatospirillum sp. J64-1]
MKDNLAIRLDPLGGVAGDMMVAALLDAFPEREEALTRALASLALPPHVSWRIEQTVVSGFQGKRFHVETPGHGHHSHSSYREICGRIEESTIGEGARRRALDIYRLLAEAEAEVHGTSTEHVVFHEVGAWDSLIDVVAAAVLIDSLGEVSWFCGSLPMGSGSVRTDHGIVPVPAPATALLLRGMPVHDDGLSGERVTPTGAAILRHLGCTFGGGLAGRLKGTGTGLGMRNLPRTLNALRLTVLEAPAPAPEAQWERLLCAAVDLDDQTPEDIAIAVDVLRGLPGVVDVTTSTVQGKKGRFVIRVEVLSRPGAYENLLSAFFAQTTTLGVRCHEVLRSTLPRRHGSAETEAGTVRIKTAQRPQGETVKAEADDLAALATTHRTRQRVRAQAEREGAE